MEKHNADVLVDLFLPWGLKKDYIRELWDKASTGDTDALEEIIREAYDEGHNEAYG